MTTAPLPHLWFMRAVYLAVGLCIIFLHLLPINTVPSRLAPPDLMMAFTFAWVLRRPDFVPPICMAALLLLGDLMLQRPPGLMALLVILGAEYLKSRLGGLRDASFAGEWASVALVVTAVTLANRLILSLMSVAQAPLSLTLVQMIATLIAYPLVVIVTQWGLGVRKPAPGDVDMIGGRA
ncbi:MAG: rod shape-determining protein MreD [Marinibacterium sp.]|nr:rod shape-determining protein MreD [Marinibacterium sp.]